MAIFGLEDKDLLYLGGVTALGGVLGYGFLGKKNSVTNGLLGAAGAGLGYYLFGIKKYNPFAGAFQTSYYYPYQQQQQQYYQQQQQYYDPYQYQQYQQPSYSSYYPQYYQQQQQYYYPYQQQYTSPTYYQQYQQYTQPYQQQQQTLSSCISTCMQMYSY